MMAKMSTWQRIENAPNRIPVLVFAQSQPDHRVWISVRFEDEWYADDAEDMFPDPTHWMPLPDPPSIG
jgi:hypothetical protein